MSMYLRSMLIASVTAMVVVGTACGGAETPPPTAAPVVQEQSAAGTAAPVAGPQLRIPPRLRQRLHCHRTRPCDPPTHRRRQQLLGLLPRPFPAAVRKAAG